LARRTAEEASRTFPALDVQGSRFRQGLCLDHRDFRLKKAVAGAVRFNSFEKKWRCGEIGYELHPDYWGKGLMTEAVRAVVACGHQTFRLNRIDAWTLPGNGASDRVLEKSGFRHEGTLRQKAWFKGAFHDFRIFGRIAADATNSK
jgi:[ribosomal protein S5]-alanine N-acetyltransferase